LRTKILFSGSRDWDWYSVFKKTTVDVISEIQYRYPTSKRAIQVVHGGARGVDSMAQQFAEETGLSVRVFKADWDNVKGLPENKIQYNSGGYPYNKSAGAERNIAMLKYLQEKYVGKNVGSQPKTANSFLIAFQQDKSKGTQHMINACKRANIPCYIFTVKYGIQLTLETFIVDSILTRRYS